MAVYDFFLSRNASAVTVNDYVGHAGRLFYDDTGTTGLRISDGVTPGGNPFTATGLATASSAGIVQPGAGLQVDELGIITIKTGEGVAFDASNNLTLAPATSDTLGGIKLGPGVTLNVDNQLVIDSEGLEFSFGDFSATVETYTDTTDFAVLSSINDNEDVVIASNGTGKIKTVGPLEVYRTDENIVDALEDYDPVFSVNSDGDVSATTLDIKNGGDIGLAAPLNVTINTNELYSAPAYVGGTIAQFTGKDDELAQIIIDHYGVDSTFGTGGATVFRTGRGTNASKQPLQEGDPIGSIFATGFASANGYGGQISGAIKIVANEDITSTARGGRVELHLVPNGTASDEKMFTFDEDGLTINRADAGVSNATFITFDTSHVDEHTGEGTLCWSAEDATLNLHHTGGVVQQIGQETYVYANNDTGSEIADGTVVRFAGADDVDGYKLQVAPFEADGTYPNIYTVGIATQSIADGANGLVTTFGKVRGLNTTGGAENWQVGDVLYVSATTAGALTNIKPTSPSNVVPVAAVLRVHATLGELFVRPTLDQRQDYGKFTRNTDVTAGSTNTANTITLDTTEQSSGISLSTPASRMVVNQSGLYNVSVQGQAYSGSETGDETYYLWLRKNGTDVPRSMKRTSTTQDQLYTTLSFSFTLSLEADDYVEVAYAFTDTGLSYEAAGATGFGPSTPSITVDITQVQN